MTQSGFYSVVRYERSKDESIRKAPKGSLLVRARVREDLEVLKEYVPRLRIWRDPSADYMFRAVMTPGEWTACLAGATQEIDYTNFKNRVAARQGEERSGVYHEVWSALLSLQPVRPVRRNR